MDFEGASRMLLRFALMETSVAQPPSLAHHAAALALDRFSEAWKKFVGGAIVDAALFGFVEAPKGTESLLGGTDGFGGNERLVETHHQQSRVVADLNGGEVRGIAGDGHVVVQGGDLVLKSLPELVAVCLVEMVLHAGDFRHAIGDNRERAAAVGDDELDVGAAGDGV